MNRKSILITGLLGVLFFGFFLWTFFSFVPVNMDEFCQYHVLACNEYPLNKLNVFRERCDACDLSLVKGGAFFPLLTYSYMGSVSAAVYYPLFKLWHSPYSSRLLGCFFLVAQAFLLFRIFRVSFLGCFFFLILFFPYAFQHIVEGPIYFQTFSILYIYYLSRQWRSALYDGSGGVWLYPAGIGCVVFLGIWTKLSYFLILPSLFCLVFYALLEEGGLRSVYLKYFKRGWIILAITAVVPSYVLLNSVNRWGDKYSGVIATGKFVDPSDAAGLMDHFILLSKFFTNPLQSAHLVLKKIGRAHV